MKYHEVKMGMKVVPTTKTYRGVREALINSGAYRIAKKRNQPYLYVTEIHPDYITLNEDDSSTGDYFSPEDFEPYEIDLSDNSKALRETMVAFEKLEKNTKKESYLEALYQELKERRQVLQTTVEKEDGDSLRIEGSLRENLLTMVTVQEYLIKELTDGR